MIGNFFISKWRFTIIGPPKESVLSLFFTAGPGEAQILGDFNGRFWFWYSISAVTDILSPSRAASSSSLEEIMLSKLFISAPI